MLDEEKFPSMKSENGNPSGKAVLLVLMFCEYYLISSESSSFYYLNIYTFSGCVFHAIAFRYHLVYDRYRASGYIFSCLTECSFSNISIVATN